MKVCKIIFACLVASIMSSQVHAETVYRWTDGNGVVHYSPLKPYGVQFETVDTSFSHVQRKLIEENKQAKAEYDLIHNKKEILAKEEEKRKQQKMRLETCVDSTYDKLSYQIRRIDNDATSAKNICVAQYNKNNQNDLYINCLKKAEQEKEKEANAKALKEKMKDLVLEFKLSPGTNGRVYVFGTSHERGSYKRGILTGLWSAYRRRLS